jgi:hypothetical protein
MFAGVGAALHSVRESLADILSQAHRGGLSGMAGWEGLDRTEVCHVGARRTIAVAEAEQHDGLSVRRAVRLPRPGQQPNSLPAYLCGAGGRRNTAIVGRPRERQIVLAAGGNACVFSATRQQDSVVPPELTVASELRVDRVKLPRWGPNGVSGWVWRIQRESLRNC